MLSRKLKDFMQLLQRDGHDVNFQELCSALRCGMNDTNIYLFSRRGKLLGYALEDGFENTPFDQEWLGSGVAPGELNDSFLRIAALSHISGSNGENILVVPLIGSGRRVGSLIFVREASSFQEDDTFVAEVASTSIGMVISHAIDEEEEDEVHENQVARSAIKSLSYSEILAMQRIFEELQEDEGLLVASRIADDAGITRSVIVNALRKLASANVIESRSLGMKGTYLRVLNTEIRNEFSKQRYPNVRNGFTKRETKEVTV